MKHGETNKWTKRRHLRSHPAERTPTRSGLQSGFRRRLSGIEHHRLGIEAGTAIQRYLRPCTSPPPFSGVPDPRKIHQNRARGERPYETGRFRSGETFPSPIGA